MALQVGQQFDTADDVISCVNKIAESEFHALRQTRTRSMYQYNNMVGNSHFSM